MKNSEIEQEKILGHNQRIHLLDSTIDVLTMNQTVNLVAEYIKEKEPLHLIGVNADKINQMKRNDYLKDIVNPELFTRNSKIPIKHMIQVLDGNFTFSPFKCRKRASALV